MSFRQGARQFFERRGAPTPPLPYDYEVEYIERDCSIPWVDAVGNEILGFFDLARYLNPDETLGTMRPLTATWSFEPIAAGVVYALYRQNGLLPRGAMKAHGNTVYSFASQNRQHSQMVGDLDVFHSQRLGFQNGSLKGYLDNELVVDVAISGVSKLTSTHVLYTPLSSSAQHYAGKMRVRNLRIGDDVDLIPVVKGNAIGFYNKVDGELFLEEQECLSAGPRV